MEHAILMAAGLGTRMKPLTERIAKPLIPVHGVPMIETVIQGLLRRRVSDIYVVVGYFHEQFDYLQRKYENLYMIENCDYRTVNNISSVYYARDALRKGSCFICEADLYVPDGGIFEEKLEQSCYYGKMVRGYSDDWVFDVGADGLITRVGKCGSDCYNMAGIAYFMEKEAVLLADAVEAAYGADGYERLFWDDVVNANLDKIKLRVHPIRSDSLIEIDTPEELRAVDKRWEDPEVLGYYEG